MRRDAFEEKALNFGLRLSELINPLGEPAEHYLLLSQLIKSGHSLGAKYAGIDRSGSRAMFRRQLSVVEALAAETICWLQLLAERKLVADGELQALLGEAREMKDILRRSIAAASGED